MPPRYKPLDDCRPEAKQYAKHLYASTDDNDPEKRSTVSTKKYIKDIRWLDDWLDEQGHDDFADVTVPIAASVGYDLAEDFNGSTGRYRWDRIRAMYDWMVRMQYIDSNPFDNWDSNEDFGLSKSPEQDVHLEDGEKYPVEQSDVRLMEEHVGRNRVRDQLIIRLLWQTGIRRGEAAGLEIAPDEDGDVEENEESKGDIDREAREITIRAEIAKNNKERVVAYQSSLDPLLSEWLDYGHRDEMLGGRDHNSLFVGEQGAPLSGDRINDIVIEAADRAGINRKLYADANAPVDEETGEAEANRWLISAHNIRHGYGSYMVNDAPENDGEDGQARIWEVSKQMGHSSVQVTEDIYVDDDPRAGLTYAHRAGPD